MSQAVKLIFPTLTTALLLTVRTWWIHSHPTRDYDLAPPVVTGITFIAICFLWIGFLVALVL